MEKHNTDKEILAILKAARKQSRDAEIAAHGKPISYAGVVRSKKLYTRKEKHKKQLEEYERAKEKCQQDTIHGADCSLFSGVRAPNETGVPR